MDVDVKLVAALIAVGIVVFVAALSRASFVVEERVEIDAPPRDVWAVLMDHTAYAAWNTQLGWLGGPASAGATLHLRLSVDGVAPYEFRPAVTALVEEQRFVWLARTGLPRVFDGEHAFVLVPLPGGRTLLTNREEYRGVLSPLLQRLPMMKLAPAGFAKMNREIKARVESTRAGARG